MNCWIARAKSFMRLGLVALLLAAGACGDDSSGEESVNVTIDFNVVLETQQLPDVALKDLERNDYGGALVIGILDHWPLASPDFVGTTKAAIVGVRISAMSLANGTYQTRLPVSIPANRELFATSEFFFAEDTRKSGWWSGSSPRLLSRSLCESDCKGDGVERGVPTFTPTSSGQVIDVLSRLNYYIDVRKTSQ